jgi:hypothetical protein
MEAIRPSETTVTVSGITKPQVTEEGRPVIANIFRSEAHSWTQNRYGRWELTLQQCAM